ncbi:MAG: hypothetical protein ABI679_15655 [Gemmatimonadota bacterium]
MTVIDSTDVEAYRSGVAAEIGLRREADRLGFLVPAELVDSATAAAAGIPVPRYRIVAGMVETLLAHGPNGETVLKPHLSPQAAPMWRREQFALDSLRLEVVVLRARTSS